jgi:hypothetical protein
MHTAKNSVNQNMKTEHECQPASKGYQWQIGQKGNQKNLEVVNKTKSGRLRWGKVTT